MTPQEVTNYQKAFYSGADLHGIPARANHYVRTMGANIGGKISTTSFDKRILDVPKVEIQIADAKLDNAAFESQFTSMLMG